MARRDAASGRVATTGTIEVRVDSDDGDARLVRLQSGYPLRLMAPSSRTRSGGRKHRDVYVLAFGGGLVGGDCVALRVLVGSHASLFVGTQGATRIYAPPPAPSASSAGAACTHVPVPTRNSISAIVEPHALLILTPDHVAPFADARFTSTQTLALHRDASLVFLDWMGAGRVHGRGEAWRFHSYASRVSILHAVRSPELSQDPGFRELMRDAWLLEHNENELVDGQVASYAAQMGAFTCVGTLMLLGPRVQALVNEAVRAFDEVSIRHNGVDGFTDGVIWSLSKITKDQLRLEGADESASNPPMEVVGVVIRFFAQEPREARQFVKQRLVGLESITGSTDLFSKQI
ncbi:UreD urease accessory protein-domain-containing protein [Chytriomyces sp. MP71]|nr:UreD urease accessory protein-domain-containing protein [Chytriomyces sp. MP71]